ncbi:Polycystic kidney disease protein 1-like 2, partial [Gonioctena quinquepunctata]
GTVCNHSENDDGNTFLIEPYALESGNYRISLNVVEYDGNGIENMLSDEGVFRIKEEKPLPTIVGDNQISMRSGDSSVDNRQSIDPKVPSNQNNSLIDEWSCNEMGKPRNDFCNRSLRNDASLVVPKGDAVDGLRYNFTFSSKTDELDWHSTSQRIRVKRGIPKLHILCVDNCQPVTTFSNVKDRIVFEAICDENCNNVDKYKTYRWSINFTNFDYEANTEFSRIRDYLFLKPNVMETDQTYLVTLEEYQLTQGPDLKELSFVLNENAKVKVELMDEYGYSNSVDVDVTVAKAFQEMNTKEELINEVNNKFLDDNSKNSLKNMIRSKKFGEVMQFLNVLTEELAQIKKNDEFGDTIKIYDMKIMNMLKEVPLIPETEQDNLLLYQVEYPKNMKTNSHPRLLKDEIADATKTFSSCISLSSVPNMGIIEITDTANVITTPFPLIDLPLVIEDYPDYGDDQNTSKILLKYASASNTMVKICYLNARSISLSMVTIDETESIGENFFKITATKKYGQNIIDTKILSQNVEVLASKDFVRFKDEEVNVLLCTSTKNPFWWIVDKNITTSVAMLAFTVQDEVVATFEKPFSISFINSETNFSWIPVHETTTPRRVDDFVIEGRYFEKMSIIRIDVFTQQGYVVEFLDLAADDFLNVYVSDFVKPTANEFEEKSTVMNGNTTTIFIPYERDFDSWHYLSILPNERMGNQVVGVKFRVYTTSCFRWESINRTWEFSCAAAESTSLARIDCLCYHSSVLAGRIRTNYVKEERTVIFLVQELAMQADLIIFLSVAVVFFLYAFLLIIIHMSSIWDYEKSIYFLSDIPGSYRYGYLIIVKTGNVFNAGTTSNVVIKLYGNQAKSKEHVLNFPDPNKRILQKNQEDWFLLATEYYLGELEKLKIWFDCLGPKPSWYCSEIEVIDIQKHKYWWFQIKFHFEISTKEKYLYIAVPVKKLDAEKKRKFSLKKFSFRGTHMWNIFEEEEVNFSRFKRLTIMLSIFMTMYTIILFFYGCPELKNSDSLGLYVEYGFHLRLIWATIGGLTITFFLHLPIVHFFRFPTRGHSFGYYVYLTSDEICWYFLTLLVMVSMTLLIILGFWVPHVTVLLWLTSAMASLVVYIFLLENFVRIAYNFTMERTTRMSQILLRLKPALANIEAQRVFVRRKFGPVSLRPYYDHLYKPLSQTRIKVCRFSLFV